MAEQNISVNDFIKQLEESREIIDVIIPSQDEPVQFYTLTTQQQKTLIETLVEDQVTNKKFYEALNKILVENLVSEFDPNQINVYDRDAIAVQLRIASIGDNFSYESTKDEEMKKIKLSSIKIKPKVFAVLTIEEKDLKITSGIPSIIDDEVYNTFLQFDNKTTDIEEITRYALDAVYLKISEHLISIEKVDTNKVFDCRKDPAATIKLVTNLPSKVFNKIYQKVQDEYIEPYNKLLALGDDRIDIKELFTIDIH